MNYKIVVLPGDGIGPEVVEASIPVMTEVGKKFGVSFDFDVRLFGGCSFDKFGEPVTVETLSACANADAVLLGAVGGPKWESLPHDKKPEAGLLKLRKSLELYANIRPARVYTGLAEGSTLKKEVIAGVDLVVVRELTGGLYFGQPRGMTEDKGWNTMAYTKDEIIRIAKSAFELAKKRRKTLCSVDKANVLEVSQFWRNVVLEVARDYPDVKLSHMYVDNAAMQLVRNPAQFDVILTENMFGDILSDIASMIPGSLGMLPSASLGTKYALYEPVHGSAPDIAGQNKANPIATIASIGMLFDNSLGMHIASDYIQKSIEKTLEQGYRTADIYSEGTTLLGTKEMAEKVKESFLQIFEEQPYGFAVA
ncbi:MAG: 3-isopropylmalate dehydrogenase [Bacteroidetes bacterium]|nr:3-isopropylmalate dehydrogenase [Bacteroidota bacterium]MCA0445844.1 3-isopropylmalate dehydrogenase [Bacteroidota bacterium]